VLAGLHPTSKRNVLKAVEGCCAAPQPLDVDALVAALKKCGFKSDREGKMKAAAAAGACLTCKDLLTIVKALSFFDEKESAVVQLFPLLTDPKSITTVYTFLGPTSQRNIVKALGH